MLPTISAWPPSQLLGPVVSSWPNRHDLQGHWSPKVDPGARQRSETQRFDSPAI